MNNFFIKIIEKVSAILLLLKFSKINVKKG
jgi:hypothetical protein